MQHLATYHHAMSPAGVAAVLLASLALDWIAIGPDNVRDRIAFFGYLAAAREGFAGSSIDQWTIQQVQQLIDQLKASTHAYIWGMTAQQLLGVLIGAFAVYVLGCLLPQRLPKGMAKWVGPVARLKFPTVGAKGINWRLLSMAAVLGVFGGLAHGLIGSAVGACINFVIVVIAPLPALLFGA